jgi:hypothetical protein
MKILSLFTIVTTVLSNKFITWAFLWKVTNIYLFIYLNWLETNTDRMSNNNFTFLSYTYITRFIVIAYQYKNTIICNIYNKF